MIRYSLCVNLFKDLNIITSIERTVGCQSQLQVKEGRREWIMELQKKNL